MSANAANHTVESTEPTASRGFLANLWRRAKLGDAQQSGRASRAWSRWHELKGSCQAPVEGAMIAEAEDPNEVLEVLVCMRHGNGPQGSPSNVQSDRGGAAAASPAFTTVKAFADYFYLTVVDGVPQGDLVILRGEAASFEKAFRVEIRRHRFGDGASYRGCTGPIYVPSELADIVVGVFGLDNRRLPWRQAPKDAASQDPSAIVPVQTLGASSQHAA